jgi:predicted DNA-binding antitoxin AbrB/MazE fold protein
MTATLQAIYENGILRPLEPLALRDHEVVTLTVTSQEAKQEPADEFDVSDVAEGDVPTLEEVRAILSKVHFSLSDMIRAERDERG